SRGRCRCRHRPPALASLRVVTPLPSLLRVRGLRDAVTTTSNLRPVRLGEVANADAVVNGKPLDGIRVLALEQMQALPYATQLLSRLGADVVKIEPPTGESGRGSLPGMKDPYGRLVGA